MIGVIALLLVLACALVFAAVTGLLFGFLYSAPAEGMPLRAALAGLAVGGFLTLWCLIERASPGRFDGPLEYSPQTSVDYPKFVSERESDTGKTSIEFTRSRGERGTVVYRDAAGRAWQRSGDGGMMVAIVVDDPNGKRRFEADLKPDRTFRIEPNKPARYIDRESGQVMYDSMIGSVSTIYYGRLIANLLWNLLHLTIWWLAFWLIMNYQWDHALGLALVFWLLFTIGFWPAIKARVQAPPPVVQAVPQPAGPG